MKAKLIVYVWLEIAEEKGRGRSSENKLAMLQLPGDVLIKVTHADFG